MDETLCHATTEPIDNPDFVVEVKQQGVYIPFYVLKRPFIDEFLEVVGKLYEVIFFTSANEDYSNKVLDVLDPNRFA